MKSSYFSTVVVSHPVSKLTQAFTYSYKTRQGNQYRQTLHRLELTAHVPKNIAYKTQNVTKTTYY